MGKLTARSRLKASIAGPASAASIEMPSTSKPSARSAWWSRSSDGASALHGGHQVAQKFTNTTLPRSSASETLPPSSSGSVKSGARVPGRSAGPLGGLCQAKTATPAANSATTASSG